MANKEERIKSIVAKNIREILQYEIKNETIGFMTVSDVIVSSDFSYVKVLVSFFNEPNKNFEKLNKLKGYVRSSLAKKVSLRRAPEVVFVLDDGYFKEAKIEKVLKKEEEELKKIIKD